MNLRRVWGGWGGVGGVTTLASCSCRGSCATKFPKLAFAQNGQFAEAICALRPFSAAPTVFRAGNIGRVTKPHVSHFGAATLMIVYIYTHLYTFILYIILYINISYIRHYTPFIDVHSFSALPRSRPSSSTQWRSWKSCRKAMRPLKPPPTTTTS